MATVRRHKITVISATIILIVTRMTRQRELMLPRVSWEKQMPCVVCYLGYISAFRWYSAWQDYKTPLCLTFRKVHYVKLCTTLWVCLCVSIFSRHASKCSTEIINFSIVVLSGWLCVYLSISKQQKGLRVRFISFLIAEHRNTEEIASLCENQ